MDPLIPGMAVGAAALIDRVLDRWSRRQQRGRLMATAAELPPGSQIGEWYGNGGWWITVPRQVPGDDG
ncbi:hypothetical protein HUT06_21510 [Actinomadura sp. NAK00032]|uniref:hypothetical protein n=1 Tax=Actinomadura sp. NAK00032 TaxID=2742128 RepID=UPI0015921E3F|nr:hypothetical protein [Actinomadura sp. NAK00032]QKW36290.1 hypothetical protein HUT06_21510 [Actinomadura sp. NAK00032]